MSTLIDIPYLRSSFDISEDISDSRLRTNIGAASRRLQNWVTAEVYQAVFDGSDDDRKEDFKLAEACLAMHFAILGFNTPITPKGIVKSAKTADNAVLSYCTPQDTENFKQLYLRQAEELIRQYVSTADVLSFALVEKEVECWS